MREYRVNIANHKIRVYYDREDGWWHMTDACIDDPRESWERISETRAQAERYARIAEDIVMELSR